MKYPGWPAAKGLPVGEYDVRINSFGAAVESTQAANGEDFLAAMRENYYQKSYQEVQFRDDVER